MNPTVDTVLRGTVAPWRVAEPTAVLAENLYQGLKDVRLTGKPSSLPVLSCVHLYTHEGCIRLETTNLSDPLRAEVGARCSQDLDLCVPWRPFFDWVAIGAASHDVLELTWDPSICVLFVSARAGGVKIRKHDRLHHPRTWSDWGIAPENEHITSTRAEFKGMDAQEFPPIREEQLHGAAPKPKTWATLCKQALKQGYSTIENLGGTVIPLLEAIHNPAYRPARVRWRSMPVNPIGEGDYWELEEFPCPAIGRHNPEALFSSYWKLGRGPVVIGCAEE